MFWVVLLEDVLAVIIKPLRVIALLGLLHRRHGGLELGFRQTLLEELTHESMTSHTKFGAEIARPDALADVTHQPLVAAIAQASRYLES